MDEGAFHWWSVERLRLDVPGAGTGSLFQPQPIYRAFSVVTDLWIGSITNNYFESLFFVGVVYA